MAVKLARRGKNVNRWKFENNDYNRCRCIDTYLITAYGAIPLGPTNTSQYFIGRKKIESMARGETII